MYLNSDELTTTVSERSSDDEAVQASKICIRRQNYKQKKKWKKRSPILNYRQKIYMEKRK